MGKESKKMDKAVSKLKKDVHEFERDWERLLSEKDLALDKEFLGKVAKDIKDLNEDALLLEKEAKTHSSAELIHHMLTTPWGAPFVSDKTFLEAAISFSYQDPLQSDLSHLMDGFTSYSSLSHNQFLSIFNALEDELRDC